jgi:hypothetical protein
MVKRMKNDKQNLTEIVNFRLTPDEKKRLERDAYSAGMSVSKYVRKRFLGQSVVSHADRLAIGELSKLGGLLKHLYNRGAVSSSDIRETINELQAAAIELREAAKRRSEYDR